MCNDENSAPHAVRYLNAQLAVLHQNAQQCLLDHANSRKEENKHFYALAEFAIQRPSVTTQIPSETDSLFYASFYAPSLRFLCSHDVLLNLTFNKGHIVLESSRSTQRQLVKFEAGLTVTYRINFRTRRIVGNDQKIGDYGSAIELVILDLDKATLCSIDPEPLSGRDVLLRYLTQYLELIHSAGNHVLFSLPQFDQRAAQTEANYSLIGDSIDYYEWLDNINGVTFEQMNAYMSSVWLKSAMLAQGTISASTTDWRPRCLAEFTRSEGSHHFYMQLGAPTVKILCEREVVIWFDIDELNFFADGNFDGTPVKQFRGWKVAVVVNVIYNKDVAGHAVTIVFDLSNAQYHDALSDYPGLDEHDEVSLDYYDLIVSFISEEYLQILYNAHYHIIYSHDTRWEMIRKMRFDLEDSGGVSSRETIQRTKMFGFDQVTAISQGSLNSQFSTTSHTVFHTWSYENYFTTTYKPFSLHLLSNNRALVWVHLASGNLKTLRNWVPWDGSEVYEFRDWRIAFEVDIKMCSQAELECATSATYTSSAHYKEHGNLVDRELRHIYLDLEHVEYVHDYSNFGDMKNLEGNSRSLILKLQAVIWYLTEKYFPSLRSEGLNIITSIPVWKPDPVVKPSLPSYALTDVTFHVYSKVEVTRHNWTQVTPGQEPIIVVLGTTGWRSLPTAQLEFSTGWIVHANRGFSHGTIGIARRVFIEERLLGLLSGVNANTTMIPDLIEPPQGFRSLTLKRWSKHEQHKDHVTRWNIQSSDGEGHPVKYTWEHEEGWSYQPRGNSVTLNISCVTHNFVELHMAVRQGTLRIEMGGNVEFGLSLLDGETVSDVSFANWSITIIMQTTITGIEVQIPGPYTPTFTRLDNPKSDSRLPDPMKMLQEAFPQHVDLGAFVEDARALEGPWRHCYPLSDSYRLAKPVFNDGGDLLFELQCHSNPTNHALAPETSALEMSSSTMEPDTTPSPVASTAGSTPSQHTKGWMLSPSQEFAPRAANTNHAEEERSLGGVTALQMDTYLHSAWLSSAMLTRGRVASYNINTQQHCLSELIWNKDELHLHIQFNAPTVKILPECKVVIVFDIADLRISFHNSSFERASVHTYQKWKIAVVVGVTCNSETDSADQAATVTYNPDDAQYHRPLSMYSMDEDDMASVHHRDLLVAFLSQDYLKLLYSTQHHFLYAQNRQWKKKVDKTRFDLQQDLHGKWQSRRLDGQESGGPNDESCRYRTAPMSGAKMHGFDQVTAISQNSLNAQFLAMSYRPFYDWEQENNFSIACQPLALQLLSENRALVWISIQRGSVRVSKDQNTLNQSTDTLEFNDWDLAFEVGIGKRTVTEARNTPQGGGTSTGPPHPQAIPMRTTRGRDIIQIFLDLEHPDYAPEYSNFDNVRKASHRKDGHILTLKLQAVMFYLTQHYFPALCASGLNVLMSIPLWKTKTPSLPSHALTSVAFHVYAETNIYRENLTCVTLAAEPCLVILGMTGSRSPPSDTLKYSTGWIAPATRGVSHGTLCISHRAFIEDSLLTLLTRLNALTTVVPFVSNRLQGFDGLVLKLWYMDERYMGRPTNWEFQPPSSEGSSKYLWQHHEESRHVLQGNSGIMNSTLGVTCATKNWLEIPTNVRHGSMKFEIYGSVELGFALQVGTTSSQIMTSSVKWSTVITMSTVDNITIVNSVSQDPVFTEANTAAHPTSWFRDPTLMLRRVFPANVELTEVVQELRAFEGPWQYCRPSMLNPYSLANPAFNEDGDLVFQLQGHRSAPLLQIDSASWSSQPVTAPVAVSPAPRRGEPTIRRPMHSISTRPLNTAITRPPSPSPSSSMIPLSPHDPQADASTVSAMSPAMPTEDVSLSEVKPSEGASRPPSSSVTPSEPPPTITSTLFDTPLVAQTEETHPVIANSIVNPSPGPQEKSSIWKSCVAKLAAGVGWDLDSW